MPGPIPDRWKDYLPYKTCIQGTRFLAFKVPLDHTFSRRLGEDELFTPTRLVKTLEENKLRLGLVIDLTNTQRYYNPQELTARGILYEKLYTQGKVVPKAHVQDRFALVINRFLAENSDNDLVIGVHCTHGLNRSGYLVCRYMIDHLGFSPVDAISGFNEARGYNIERENYIADLLGSDREGAEGLCSRLQLSPSHMRSPKASPRLTRPDTGSHDIPRDTPRTPVNGAHGSLEAVHQPSTELPTEAGDHGSSNKIKKKKKKKKKGRHDAVEQTRAEPAREGSVEQTRAEPAREGSVEQARAEQTRERSVEQLTEAGAEGSSREVKKKKKKKKSSGDIKVQKTVPEAELTCNISHYSPQNQNTNNNIRNSKHHRKRHLESCAVENESFLVKDVTDEVCRKKKKKHKFQLEVARFDANLTKSNEILPKITKKHNKKSEMELVDGTVNENIIDEISHKKRKKHKK